MVFEIPEDVNVYDLIAVAVIEQAAQDSHSADPKLAKEARIWLENEGSTWWEIMRLGDESFERMIINKKPVTEK